MPEKPTKLIPTSGRTVRRWISLFYALPVLFVLGLFGNMAYNRAMHKGPPVRKISSAPFTMVKLGGLEARLFAQGDALRASGNDLFIEFRDSQGKMADVGEVSLELVLKMPDTIMHSIGRVMRTATPGQYRTTIEPGLRGDWTATLGFTGQRGQAETNFLVKVM